MYEYSGNCSTSGEGAQAYLISFQFPEYDDLYCNYSFVSGQDWAVVSVSSSVYLTQVYHLV